MEYSAESLRYLHIAYTIFIAVQVSYVAWLAARWNRVTATGQQDQESTQGTNG